MIHHDIRNSTTLLRRYGLMPNQGYSDNNLLKSCDSGHEDEHKFGKCLSCSKFHSFNFCVFPNFKFFKCGKIEHIQAVYNTTVHFGATNTKLCNSGPTKLSVSNDHLSLFTTSDRFISTVVYSYHEATSNEYSSHCEKCVLNKATSFITWGYEGPTLFDEGGGEDCVGKSMIQILDISGFSTQPTW
ncbi:unnamed protein product [Schistosoma curassoni]|uniref:Gag_pre-integrs domain-containing protein n=1 Tax=Schistosoma curassoni TaxID=6186 RepID=A0A183K1J2_9TREM|nr:unnamed protein product [Schistosoma curassoni]